MDSGFHSGCEIVVRINVGVEDEFTTDVPTEKIPIEKRWKQPIHMNGIKVIACMNKNSILKSL